MKYVGSKNRISKYIIPILQKLIDDNNASVYYEPFVGANMIDKIKCEYKIGNDIHKELIALLRAVQSGWIPPDTITEEGYNKVKQHKEDYPDYYVGLVGFCATFGAKYFGGYARARGRDMPNEAIRNLMRQVPYISDIKFMCDNYLDVDMSIFHNAVIYCDPPYHDTTKFSTGKFDYNKFYDWCKDISKTNILCVSEYDAPSDFKCIWQKKHYTTLKLGKSAVRTENCLFLTLQKPLI